jgi:PKHD-type hydroxylase
MSILNNPTERANVIYPNCTWDNTYSTDELELLEAYCSKLKSKAAIIFSGDGSESVDTDVRISNISFAKYDDDDEIKWFFHKTNNIIQSLNERFYQFDLNGYDQFQYGEYDGDKKSKYDYHLDMAFGWPKDPLGFAYGHRKLSFILCLSDPSEYEGGKLLINIAGEENSIELPQEKGRVIVFPSFIMHKVSEVTSGKRKSIVIWITGPKFK